MSGYLFGKRSLANLEGVHPSLVEVALRAISVSEIDFAVTQGLRTIEEQEEYVARGASWTLDSRHLTGHAIDIVALLRGVARWEFPLYAKIAEAFRTAGASLHVPIIWGGVWDRPVTEIGFDLLLASDLYRDRFVRTFHRRPRRDGPHFELPRSTFPVDATT